MINRIVKTGILSGALALCVTLFGVGCGTVSSANDPNNTTAETADTSTSSDSLESPRLTACDQFCENEGGQFFRSIGATTQAQCTSRGGDWSPTPAPGCCCKCQLLNGNCD